MQGVIWQAATSRKPNLHDNTWLAKTIHLVRMWANNSQYWLWCVQKHKDFEPMYSNNNITWCVTDGSFPKVTSVFYCITAFKCISGFPCTYHQSVSHLGSSSPSCDINYHWHWQVCVAHISCLFTLNSIFCFLSVQIFVFAPIQASIELLPVACWVIKSHLWAGIEMLISSNICIQSNVLSILRLFNLRFVHVYNAGKKKRFRWKKCSIEDQIR